MLPSSSICVLPQTDWRVEVGCPIGTSVAPRWTPIFSDRERSTFLTSSSINNARACHPSDRFLCQRRAGQLHNLDRRDIPITATQSQIFSRWLAERESLSAGRLPRRMLRGRRRSPTARRPACRLVSKLLCIPMNSACTLPSLPRVIEACNESA